MGHEETQKRRSHVVEPVKVFVVRTNTPGEPPYTLNHIQLGRIWRQVEDGESVRPSLRQKAHRSFVPAGVVGDHNNLDSWSHARHKLLEEGRTRVTVERISRPGK